MDNGNSSIEIINYKMSNKIIYRIIQIVAVLSALMYVQSFNGFVFGKEINFIQYIPQTNLELWTVRNLGIRLLAIAVGFFIALLLRNKTILAVMFTVRLTADIGDLINSATTPNLAPMVWQILTVFVVIEFLCLMGLIHLIKKEKKDDK